MLTGPLVILILKVAVVAVTIILGISVAAILRGNRKLHGRLQVLFTALTLVALLGLEIVARLLNPDIFDYFDENTRKALFVHLWFSLPSAAMLPIMLYTGWRNRTVHVPLAFLFTMLWTGTVVTGVFFLPHQGP